MTMKSLSEISQSMLPVPTAMRVLTELPVRTVPMTMEDVSKLQTQIEKHFMVRREETYGYVPVVEGGQTVRQEYDLTGEVVVYEPRGEVPPKLWEAMLRPSRNNHVIYHLGRLAAHRRDTRGNEAFQVVMEDVAADVAGASEWAVVMACAEMRRKNTAWYPNTGEIINIIKKYEKMLDGLYLKKLAAKPPAPSVPKRNMADYYQDPRDNPIRRIMCEFLTTKGLPDYFAMTRLYSNYQLEMLAGHHGWKKEPAATPQNQGSTFGDDADR